jgi:hypothetical protein
MRKTSTLKFRLTAPDFKEGGQDFFRLAIRDAIVILSSNISETLDAALLPAPLIKD